MPDLEGPSDAPSHRRLNSFGAAFGTELRGMALKSGHEKEALLPPKKDVSSVPQWLRILQVIVVCGVWMLISSLLIIVNKHIMVDLKFHFPMAVSGMGMFVSAIASFLCCRVFKVVEAKAVIEPGFYLRKLMPIGFFMALTLITGNHVYLYLTVSFIQMLKAFTPVITMFALFIARLESPSYRLIWAVLLISVGTAMAAAGEVNLSYIGVTLMLTSEAAEATRLVMTQYLLVGLRFHPIEGLMYLAPACFIWLFGGVLVYEWKQIAAEGAVSIAMANKWEFLCAACMGFAVNGLAFNVIKLASSLTLKVLGTVKNALLVVFGVFLLQEVVTGMQGWGYAVSLLGFAWYNQIKMSEVAPAQTTNTKV